jgi:hypothetical protein
MAITKINIVCRFQACKKERLIKILNIKGLEKGTSKKAR